MSFSFIDDKNKILDIDSSQNYYLAGKNQDVLFISKTFNISDGIITFDVDTYTEPFLNEIKKRNTEIQIELGYNTSGIQKVLLRDYAFAQPRVYIEGLNPSKVDLNDYYTKDEVDKKLSELPEIPTKVSELQNDSGFISVYTETDPIFTAISGDLATKVYVDEALNNAGGNNTGRIFSDPKFLYLNSYTQVSETNLSAIYTGVLGDNPPSSSIILNKGFRAKPNEIFFDMTLTYTTDDDFVLTPNDELDMVIGSNYTTPKQIITCELYVDSILIRKGQIALNEGFENNVNPINCFSLIKLNEIVDDKKITGNCLLEIKIKYYNGINDNRYESVSIRQNAYKIFTEDNNIHPYYYGLAKNMYLEDYYCYGKGFDLIFQVYENRFTNLTIQRQQIYGDSFNNSLSENYVYYMPSDYHTSQLNINGFGNNSMIVFNTDPDTDFTYSFSVDSGWKINKPFNFQKGKSYVIATEANCIFWNEVQNYE